MDFSNKTTAIGLYSYRRAHPGADVFRDFFSQSLNLINRLGFSATYTAPMGDGFSGKMVKYNQRMHSRVLASLDSLWGLSLIVNPPKSDSPAYDNVFYCALGYNSADTELLFCLSLNAALLSINTNPFDVALEEYVALYDWSFGMAFLDEVENRPELHVLGMGNGRQTPEEEKRGNAWYAAKQEERMSRLRWIYPYNVLDREHLAIRLSDGQTLEAYISRQPDSAISVIGDRGLAVWRIPDERALKRHQCQLLELHALIE